MDIEEFNCFVGKRIKQARLDAGLSAQVLGEILGLSVKSARIKIYQIESGNSGVDFSRIVIIAKATGKSLYFFTGDYLQ